MSSGILNEKTVLAVMAAAVLFVGCGGKGDTPKVRGADTADTLSADTAVAGNGKPADFVPDGYKIFEEVKGDLNKDGLDDYVLIIKGTDRKNFVDDGDGRGRLDRNRRGIVIVFNRGERYERALENRECFSSENEDGGVYFPPELSVSVKKGNLYIEYFHGRYGSLYYTFRYQNSDFELIGYDKTELFAPYILQEISINFLTKKTVIKRNTKERNIKEGEEDIEEGDNIPTFKETWTNITLKEPIRLRKIVDFDDLGLELYHRFIKSDTSDAP